MSRPAVRFWSDTVSRGEPLTSADTWMVSAALVQASGESVIPLMPQEPGKLLNLAPFISNFPLGE